jgi:PAS domain S-box-containing protein
MDDDDKTRDQLICELRELRGWAGAELEQTHAYLQNVFENSPDAIGIVDAHGKFVMWNRLSAELYGYSFEELRGKSAFDLYASEPELRSMLDCLRREDSVKKWEIRMKRKDGTIVPCELSIGLLKDRWGRSIGSVCVARDLSDINRVLADLRVSNEQLRREIADRRKAEEELKEYREHLEDLVRERTAELGQVNDRLRFQVEERRQAEQTLKFFAYSVAHDLKSPTIGILGLARLIQRQYKSVLDEKGLFYCDQISKVSEHIATFVEKLNLYITTQENPCRIEKINFSEIVRTMKEEFSEKLAARRIEWVEPECDVEIAADRLSMLRVFRNLIENCLKYGGDGLSEIRIGHTETEDFHVFSVADDGMGLEGVHPDRLFGLFQRHETSRGTEGAGLGLAIVKDIAERHGGKAWAEPEAKRGAVFCISISKDL